MAKKKSRKKSRKSRKNKRRRNPLSRRRRRNPDLGSLVKTIAGEGGENVINAAVGAVGGGAALAIASKLLGERLGEGTLGQGALAVAAGVGGGVVALLASNALVGTSPKLAQFLATSAAPVATVAIGIGLWNMVQGQVTEWLAGRGLAGYGSWGKEFDGYLGQSVLDEFTSGVSPGTAGYLGAGVIADTENVENVFAGYEPLGDIYGNQRLGSFEAEPGFAGHVAEIPNPADQQVADQMKHDAGHYGPLSGYGDHMFDPTFEVA